MKNLKFFATLILILSLSIFIFSGELEEVVKDFKMIALRGNL